MREESLMDKINSTVLEKDLLKHPFYTSWSDGKLTLNALRGYSKQYYKFVAMFPRFLSAVHSNCPDLETRQRILENLSEEEDREKPHPELWLNFCESLGLSREDVINEEPLPETSQAIEELNHICRDESFLAGVAALYAYESRVPEIAKTKIEGLEKFYDITDEKGLEFFRLHQEVDVWHSEIESRIICDHVHNSDDAALAVQAADKSISAMNKLLDGVYREYVACESIN